MRNRAFAIHAVCLIAGWPTASTALAQSASIEGRIVDEQTLAIPGVTVTLTSPATGFVRRTASDDQGAYRIPGLLPGVYDIRAALDGFATMEQRATTVNVAAVVRVAFSCDWRRFSINRSALPVNLIQGFDRNNDFNNNDLPDRAYAFDGVGSPAREIGPCTTVNCGRGASFSQLNVRASKRFALPRGSRLELIVEMFNLFNADNPAVFNRQRLLGLGNANPSFMQPTSYAGDFQQPEQRVGQIGVRWLFGK
jgi:hypothetical protein